MPRKRILAALAALLLHGGCATAPPASRTAGDFLVRASTDKEAARLAETVAEVDSEVRTFFGAAPHGCEVWLVGSPSDRPRTPRGYGLRGGLHDNNFLIDDRIEVETFAWDYLGRTIVAHELVHHYVEQKFGIFSFLGGLPQWLDEGFAYALASDAALGRRAPAEHRPLLKDWAEFRKQVAQAQGREPDLDALESQEYEFSPVGRLVVDTFIRDEARRDPRAGWPEIIPRVFARARGLSLRERWDLAREAVRSFPTEDEALLALRELSFDPDSVKEMLGGVAPGTLARVAAPDPRARTRLAWIEREDPTFRPYIESLLADPESGVRRTAVAALAAGGDTHMLGPLVDAVRGPAIGIYLTREVDDQFMTVPLHETLVKLAGGLPPGATPGYAKAPGANTLLEVKPETADAWARWWASRSKSPTPAPH
jgi:hypothetical protein